MIRGIQQDLATTKVKFEIAIEGQKFIFRHRDTAIEKFKELKDNGYYETVLRMTDGKTVYVYNAKVGAFFHYD